MKKRRRIVPVLVHEEDAVAPLSAEDEQKGWPGAVLVEHSADAMDDEGRESDEDDGDSDDGEDGGTTESDSDGEGEEDDVFCLEQLDPAQHLRAFVELQSMRVPAPSDAPSTETSAPVVTLTAEEEKEEKEAEEEGLRIEESFTLDPALLADDGSSVVSSSSTTASARRSILSDDAVSSSLHSYAWQKHDLDTLYNSLRPPPTSPQEATPSLLLTPLLPFQRQALWWMIYRETTASRQTFPHPLYEYSFVHGERVYYHRVTGEVQLEEPERVQDVMGGILAEQMGLGKTMEMIALVLARPYKPDVAVVAPLLPTLPAPTEEKEAAQELSESDAVKEDAPQDALPPATVAINPALSAVIPPSVRKKVSFVIKSEPAAEQGALDAALDVPMADLMSDLSASPSVLADAPVSSPPAAPLFSPSGSPFSPRASSSPVRSPPISGVGVSAFSGPSPPSMGVRRPSSPVVINRQSSKPEVKGTLIITPVSIVYQWKSEIEKHAPSLKVLIYKADMNLPLFPQHASSSSSSPSSSLSSSSAPSASPAEFPVPSAPLSLSEYDVVLTNYAVLAAQVNYSQSPPYAFRQAKQYAVPLSPLVEVHWHRLVLDEAQRVQNGVGNSARMAMRVPSSHRWCVTGTPIGLHGLNDVYGLVLFLGLQPYSSFSTWLKTMTVENEEGMTRLVTLLRRVMWRQSKQHVKEQISLPPLHTHTHFLSFNEVEHEAYRRFEYEVRGKLYFQVARGLLAEAKDHVGEIDALRQMCDHPQVLASGLFAAKGAKRFDTMDVIGRRILQKAKDDVSEKEREVCRLLNEMGLLLKRHGRDDDSERYLKESWNVYDKGIVDAKAGDRERKALKDSVDPHLDGLELKPRDAKDAGGEFKAAENIVTPNTQARMWRFIELVASWHLRDLLKARMQRCTDASATSSTATAITPSSSSSSSVSSSSSSFSTSSSSLQSDPDALRASIDQLTEIVDKAADELTDLLGMQHEEAQEFIVQMTDDVIPLWSTNPSPDVAAVLAAFWEAHPDVSAFFQSAHFREARVLYKKYQVEEKWAESICLLFDLEEFVAALEELIRARSGNASVCVQKQYVHQELLSEYYPSDVQPRIDALLSKALRARQKEYSTVQDKLRKLARTDHEQRELSAVDWTDTQQRVAYEAQWSKARANAHCMLALTDLRKGFQNEKRLSALRAKAREYLFKLAADPPPNFGQEAIPLKAIERDHASEADADANDRNGIADDSDARSGEDSGDERGQKDERSAHEAVKEPLQSDAELQAALAQMQAQLAGLRVSAQQKQRHVKYLQNKLSHLTTASSSASSGSVNGEMCPICNQAVVQPVITMCGHVYCLNCLQDWMKKGRRRTDGEERVDRRLGGWERGTCPTCRTELTREDVVEMPQDRVIRIDVDDDDAMDGKDGVDDDDDAPFHTVTTTSSYSPSSSSASAEDVCCPPLSELASLHFPGEGESGTKVDWILRHLLYLYREHPKTKSLVYSQFPRMLLLFSQALSRAGVPHLELHGPPDKAAKQISTFQTTSHFPVLLLSLRRDSSGLTLVSASHVFVLEPSLERSVELQAVNRIHRIGQRKVCHVHRFVMKKSLEARIERQVHGGATRNSSRKRKRRPTEHTKAKDERKEHVDVSDGKEEKVSDRDEDGLTGSAMDVDERKDGSADVDDDDDDDEDAVVIDKGFSQRRKELLNTGDLLTYLDLHE